MAIASLSLVSPLLLAELPVEQIPSVAVLPEDYPKTWLFAHDANFNSLIAGKVVIVDAAADTQEVKGMVDAAQMAAFIESEKQPLLYVAETFYSRGTRGDRTDVVSIYDKSTLNQTGEILLPKNNRAQLVLNKNSLQLVDEGRFLLVYAFTPAQSVMIIDTESRSIINEVSIAGCALAYPNGKRGFMSLCGDGSLLAIQFDKKGKETQRYTTEPFFNIDDDPLFDKAVYMGQTAYFVSYKGKVQPIDGSGDIPKIEEPWSLVTPEEAEQNWRTGGWQVSATDGENLLYVIMHKDGYDGSHKFGGEEIWVFDTQQKKKIKTIVPQTNAFSIELTQSNPPLLAVTNVTMGLDVYSTEGEFLRYINVGDGAMPLMLHAEN